MNYNQSTRHLTLLQSIPAGFEDVLEGSPNEHPQIQRVRMQHPFVGWVFKRSKSNTSITSVPFTIFWIIGSVFFTAFFVTTTRTNLSSTF